MQQFISITQIKCAHIFEHPRPRTTRLQQLLIIILCCDELVHEETARFEEIVNDKNHNDVYVHIGSA